MDNSNVSVLPYQAGPDSDFNINIIDIKVTSICINVVSTARWKTM